MKLVIVESPTKAKTIQKYLGKDYRVMASGGHACDLPEKSLGIDVEHDFKPSYVMVKEKKDKWKRVAKNSRHCNVCMFPGRIGNIQSATKAIFSFVDYC